MLRLLPNSTSAQNKWRKYLPLFFLTGIISCIGSLIVSLSIPNEYHAYKKISVDGNKSKILEKGSKFGLIKKKTGLSEATIPTDPAIYIRILRTPQFQTNLTTIKVRYKDGRTESYAQHLINAKTPWWENSEDMPMLYRVNDRVKYYMDMHSGIITMQVEDQDPQIATQVIDSVAGRLQNYLYIYMRKRAAIDLSNRENDLKKATKAYYKAMDDYSKYADANMESEMPSVKTNLEALQQHVNFTEQQYQTAVNQYAITKMKNNQIYPNFIELVNTTLPLSPSRPHWIANILVWLFYGWLFTLWFVLFWEKHLRKEVQHG